MDEICRRPLHIPVRAPEGARASTWYVAGWLTVPAVLRRSELQILLHGACYDHRYWDWPIYPAMYSYVEWAATRGIATLAIDRVGSGQSSRPPGTEATVSAQADLLGEIVGAARSFAFDRVAVIGHSLGSVIAGYRAATAGDVDSIVLTGYLPVKGPLRAEERLLTGAFMPALVARPDLVGLIDDDYFAPFPGQRGALMYNRDYADSQVIAVDEEIKGITSRGELLGTADAGPIIRSAEIPTLVVVGQHDILLMDRTLDVDCRDSVGRVASLSPQNFTYHVVENAGHNLNLHRNAPDTFARIDEWMGAQPVLAADDRARGDGMNPTIDRLRLEDI